MNTSELIYQGELRTLATHIYSGTQIFTDAPLDNHGKAQSFSPTDLLAVSLASCIMTTIAIQTRAEELKLEGTVLTVKKIMASNPRRVAAIEIEITIVENNLTYPQKMRLEQIAHDCPVAKSLHKDLEQRVSFTYV